MRNLFFLSGLIILFSGVFGLGNQARAANAYSAPMGFYELDLEIGYQSVGVSVVNSALFGSWISGSGASSITSADSSVDVGGLLDGTKKYYIEIVEGSTGIFDAYVGQRFEVDVTGTIAAGTANGVVLLEMDSERTTWVNDPVTVPTTAPALTDYRFELRAHVTLGQVFDPSALYGSASFASADQVQFFDGAGFSIYYVLGDNSSFAQWTQQSGGDFSSKDDLPIAPGQGLIFKRSTSSSGPISLRVKGMARSTPFVQPMKSGYNFVSEAYPLSNSFDGKGAYPGAFNNSDRVQVYDGSGFTTYMLLSDGLSTNLWVDALDSSFTSQNLSEIFDYRGAVFVDLDASTSGYRIDPPPDLIP